MDTPLSLTPREEMMWLVALLEGEGCFTKNGAYPNIVVSMTDEDTVRSAYKIAGCGEVSGPYPGKQKHHKPFWRWKVSDTKDVFALCHLVLPYMSFRRSVAIQKLQALQSEVIVPIWVRVAEWEK